MNARLLLPLVFSTAALAQEAAPTAEQLNFFEKKIRPVLAEHCYKCHSERSEKIRGGLVLDTREGIRRGGDNGPAVVPGKLDESLLIEAVRYANKDFAMPPEKSGGKLPDAVIADFEAWVKMGAPDPREGAAKVVKKHDAEEAKKWWAFQPPQKSAPPTVKDTAWPRGEIDRFLLAGLEAKGLKPVGEASAATLIRRVYFDLTGLPPTLKETDDFMKDPSPDALAKVVDRLLASPQFGERWGRHWLDVARYAESSGKDVNLAYPHAWRYRDYVIASFNAGKPFDQFIREQIAGDLLPAKDDQQRAEQAVATGFLALGAKSHNEMNPRQFYLDLADEQIDAMSQAVLGMTVACARCHDHKFDPIPQRDYYALAGIFLSTDTRFGTVQGVQNRHPSELIELPKAARVANIDRKLSPEELAQAKTRLEELQKEQQEIFGDRLANRRTGPDARPPVNAQDQQRILRIVTQIGQVEGQLKAFDENGYPRALAMGVQDLPASRAATFGQNARRLGRGRFGGFRPPDFASIMDSALYARGEADRPGERVPRGFPAVLTKDTAPTIAAGASGRRELAEWLTAESNPLTARVFVNRTWHWLFGRGLVESCDNFGTTGQQPSNQALLDTLAVRFMENGWNVKALIREIVLSRAYALASTYEDKAFHADPENQLVWRANQRRLDAECVRDAMLAASGQLDLAAPVGSALARNGEGPIVQRRGIGQGRGFGTSEETLAESGGATATRSVYLPIARDVPPDALAVFDFVDSTLVTGTRETTNVPTQALFLLNSSFATQQAGKFAARVMAAYPGGPNATAAARLDERLRYAYWLVFNRAPEAAERQAAANFFAKFPSNWAKGDPSAAGLKDAADVQAAWTSFCRALFASAEFRYLN